MLEKYPFLSTGKAALGDAGLASVGAADVDAAARRVAATIAVASGAESPSLAQSARQAVQDYALSRVLLALLGSDYYWQKFAKGEAVRAAECLRKAPGDLPAVARDFFPSIAFDASGLQAEIPVAEFLQQGGELPAGGLQQGKVFLSHEELLAALRKAVFRKALSPLSLPRDLPELFKSAAASLRSSLPKPVQQESFKGKYLALACVRSILAGAAEGKRYYASMSLAIACRKDGLQLEAAREVMAGFAAACQTGSRPFTEREALASLEWVYKRNINFSCKFQREHGLADLPDCANCTLRAERRAAAVSAARREGRA